MKLNVDLIYPAVTRRWPNPSDVQTAILIQLNVGCDSWKTNTAMRHAFCELIFAGAGNHPGLWDGDLDQEFDSGDQGINNVHKQWEKAKTRSASVGDVVCIDPDGIREYWVCDCCGWTLLTPEQSEAWLKYPRQYGCSSIELAQWMDTLTTQPDDAMVI